ncbi:hypothetical protein [Salinactinospora qingdaonensis]
MALQRPALVARTVGRRVVDLPALAIPALATGLAGVGHALPIPRR